MTNIFQGLTMKNPSKGKSQRLRIVFLLSFSSLILSACGGDGPELKLVCKTPAMGVFLWVQACLEILQFPRSPQATNLVPKLLPAPLTWL